MSDAIIDVMVIAPSMNKPTPGKIMIKNNAQRTAGRGSIISLLGACGTRADIDDLVEAVGGRAEVDVAVPGPGVEVVASVDARDLAGGIVIAIPETTRATITPKVTEPATLVLRCTSALVTICQL